MRTSLARFPFVKGLESFDFAYQPSLDKKHIEQTVERRLHRARRENRHSWATVGGQDDSGGGLGIKAIEKMATGCSSPRRWW